MMTTSPTDHAVPEGRGPLPMQPTGSGVADLEIAYEQMKLAENEHPDHRDEIPLDDDTATAESAAHPS